MVLLKRLVDELDETAWDLQEEADAGRVPYERYFEAFSRARAANSLLYAFAPDPFTAAAEAAYEAQHALEDPTKVSRFVTSILES